MTEKQLIEFCEARMKESEINHGYYQEIKMVLEEIADHEAK